MKRLLYWSTFSLLDTEAGGSSSPILELGNSADNRSGFALALLVCGTGTVDSAHLNGGERP